MYIYYFAFIASWRRVFFQFSPLYSRILHTNFGWNWPSGSEEILYAVSFILICRYHLPLEIFLSFHLNYSPLYPRMPCAKFKELNLWFWRTEDFFKKGNRQYIFNNPLICFLLKKDVILLLNRLESPLSRDA